MTDFLKDGKIIENKEIGTGNYLLKIKIDDTMIVPKTGQFYLLKCKNEMRILKRPISLHSVDRENKILEFVYKVMGKGTEEMSLYKAGDTINIQGPLGTGFEVGIIKKKAVVIGGGIGLAPLKQLINDIKNENEVTFIAGGRDKEALKILGSFDLSRVELLACSDDGSFGKKALVTQLLKELLLKEKIDIIYTCGPHIMMEKIAEIAHENNIRCEVSMEERMACGIKACVGCSIKTKIGMKKVCYDGPVFDSQILIMKDLDTVGIEDIKCV
ncbi:MAG: dihydroorotate dehydrogenase electron transfer subunit [Sebaldella sp.]|nr:dihydroorotate dehydrogenase electron transfer subunit [Sebaldella sp.]